MDTSHKPGPYCTLDRECPCSLLCLVNSTSTSGSSPRDLRNLSSLRVLLSSVVPENSVQTHVAAPVALCVFLIPRSQNILGTRGTCAGVWGSQGESQAALAWEPLHHWFAALQSDPGSLLKSQAPNPRLPQILIRWLWSWAQAPALFIS